MSKDKIIWLEFKHNILTPESCFHIKQEGE